MLAMSQLKTRRALDAQAKAVAQQDSKFVAKLSGQKQLQKGSSGHHENGSRSSTPTQQTDGCLMHIPASAAPSLAPTSSSQTAASAVQPSVEFGNSQQTAAGTSRAAANAPSPVQDSAPQAATLQSSRVAEADAAARHQRPAIPLTSVLPNFQPPPAHPTWLRATTAPAAATATAATATTGPAAATSSSPPAGRPATIGGGFGVGPMFGAAADARLGAVNRGAVPTCQPNGPANSALQEVQQQQQPSEGVQRGDCQAPTSWLLSMQPPDTAQPAAGASMISQQQVITAIARPDSPSWFIKALVQSGPVQQEASLYAAWTEQLPATTQLGDTLTEASAAAAEIGGNHAVDMNVARAFLQTPARRTVSPLAGTRPLELTALGRPARVPSMTAPAAVAPGMLPGSNFSSSRAETYAAGVNSAGSSRLYQPWLAGRYAGSKPPRREDTESVKQWLVQQLQDLQRIQQRQQQQPGTQQLQQQPLRPKSPARQRPQDGMAQTVQAASTAQAQQHQQQHSLQANRPGSPAPHELSAGITADGDLLANIVQPRQNGLLDFGYLQQQEEALSAAFDELCRQVATRCVDQGHLMTQLWLSLRSLLLAVVADRQAAIRQEAAAEASAAAVQQQLQELQRVRDNENIAARAINQRHAAKVEASRKEADQYKQTIDQDLLSRLSGAQQLVQRVMDLEAHNKQQAATISLLQDQLETAQTDLKSTKAQLDSWHARGSQAEAWVKELDQRLRCSTPRPERDLGILGDLLNAEEGMMVQEALIAGVDAEHVHQLLLGLSSMGDDIRPWLALAGSAVPALRTATDPGHLHKQLRHMLASCDAAGLSRCMTSPSNMNVLSHAIHMGVSPDTLLQVMDGSLGLPIHTGIKSQVMPDETVSVRGGGTGWVNTARTSSSANPVAFRGVTSAGVKQDTSKGQDMQGLMDQKHWQSVSDQQPQASTVPQQSQGGQNAAQAKRLLDSLPGVGAALPYLSLVGVLATKFGHDSRELGGPVTAAVQQAQLSTRARVEELEARAKTMHREIVLLKRTLADQQKHEQGHIAAALKDQKRKYTRREARQPSLIDRFLQAKWGDYFEGIGQNEELPRVLQSARVPINNKRMPKRDAEKLVHDIWQFKADQEAAARSQTGARVNLAEATAVFLEKRFFSVPRLVTEVAYNFVYSLGQHSYDADCNLFLRVFTGEVEEAVKEEQQALQAQITQTLKLMDVSVNQQATGWLHKSDVKTALAGFFKGKKVDRLSEIHEALDTDQPGEALYYPDLFSDDEHMNQGMTAEVIRSQHLQERLEFLQEIEDAIREAAEDHQTTTLTAPLLHSSLRKALRNMDPATVNAIIARWAFGPQWQEQHHGEAQPLGVIIKAIRRGSWQPGLKSAATSAAGAVSKIAPVGKFKTKLMSALRLGLREGANKRVSIAGTAFKASTAHLRRSNIAGQAPEQQPAAGTAAAAATVSSAGTARSERYKLAAADATGAASIALTGSAGLPAQSGQIPDSTAIDYADEAAAAVEGTEQWSSHLPMVGSGSSSSRTNDTVRGRSSSVAAVSGHSKASAVLTVGLLSAMEAVRQSWLKEEEDKLMHSTLLTGANSSSNSSSTSGQRCTSAAGNAATHHIPYAAVSAYPQVAKDDTGTSSANAASGQHMQHATSSNSGAEVPALGSKDDSVNSAFGSAAGGYASTSEYNGYGSSVGLQVPAVPALQLGDMFSGKPDMAEWQEGSSSGRRQLEQLSSRSSRLAGNQAQQGVGRSTSGLTQAAPAADGTPQLQHSQFHQPVADITSPRPSSLSHLGAAGNAAAADGIAAGCSDGSPTTPRSACKKATFADEVLSDASTSMKYNEVGSLSSRMQRQSCLAAERGAGVAATSATNFRRRKAPPAALLLTDADDVIESLTPSSANLPGSVAMQASVGGSGTSSSNTPGCGGVGLDDVCYTPHSPAEGGKRNALVMRRLNKGKSLKRLEEVMLMVVAHGTEGM